jgi:hypothetical protein
LLPAILSRINKPCLFWLDGHYSAGGTAKGEKNTPIMEELTAIHFHPVKNHIILIDDAREFYGENDYPTIQELRDFCGKMFPDHDFKIKDDIIQIFPNKVQL